MTPLGRNTREQWGVDEPEYGYAREMLDRPEYQGRSWTTVEHELRRDWEQRYADKPWDTVSESIRDVWEGMTSQGSDEADRRRFDEEHGSGGDDHE